MRDWREFMTLPVCRICKLAVVAALLPAAYAQYGGPAILTRGQAPTGMSSAQIDFRPFVTFDGDYDNGLNGVSVDFKDEVMGRGFVFNNPNASHTCGCGSSFSA